MFSRILRIVAPGTYLVISLGCATAGKGVAMSVCLSDPPTRSMLCKKSPEGDEFDIPWDNSGDMICMPRGDYRYLLNKALQ